MTLQMLHSQLHRFRRLAPDGDCNSTPPLWYRCAADLASHLPPGLGMAPSTQRTYRAAFNNFQYCGIYDITPLPASEIILWYYCVHATRACLILPSGCISQPTIGSSGGTGWDMWRTTGCLNCYCLEPHPSNGTKRRWRDLAARDVQAAEGPDMRSPRTWANICKQCHSIKEKTDNKAQRHLWTFICVLVCEYAYSSNSVTFRRVT